MGDDALAQIRANHDALAGWLRERQREGRRDTISQNAAGTAHADRATLLDMLQPAEAVIAAAVKWQEADDEIDAHLGTRSVPPDELYDEQVGAFIALSDAVRALRDARAT